MPVVPLKAPPYIIGITERRLAIDGNAVIVIDTNQFAETQMSSEGCRFMGGAFHDIAVAHEHVRTVIHYRVARSIENARQMRLRHCHAQCIHESLSERACGRLDTRRKPVFGMPRRLASPLTKTDDLMERKVITAQMENRVKKHGGMTAREHEAVPVKPVGISGIIAQVVHPQFIRQRRQSHWRSRMAAVRLLHRIHRKCAYGVNRLFGDAHAGKPLFLRREFRHA